MSEIVAAPKLGRPSSYDPAIAAIICEQIAAGQSTEAVAKQNGTTPQTIYTWLYRHESFLEDWQRARAASVEALADEIRRIADDDSKDVLVDQHGRPMGNVAAVKRAELRVNHRMWLMAKWSKRYQDKQQIEHSGSVTLELGSKLDTALRYRATAESALIDVTPDTAATQSEPSQDATPALPAL